MAQLEGFRCNGSPRPEISERSGGARSAHRAWHSQRVSAEALGWTVLCVCLCVWLDLQYCRARLTTHRPAEAGTTGSHHSCKASARRTPKHARLETRCSPSWCHWWPARDGPAGQETSRRVVRVQRGTEAVREVSPGPQFRESAAVWRRFVVTHPRQSGQEIRGRPRGDLLELALATTSEPSLAVRSWRAGPAAFLLAGVRVVMLSEGYGTVHGLAFATPRFEGRLSFVKGRFSVGRSTSSNSDPIPSPDSQQRQAPWRHEVIVIPHVYFLTRSQ